MPLTMDMIRLTNTKPRILHLPDAIIASANAEGPRIVGVGSGKSLLPGGNNMAREEWEKVKRHKEVASWIKLGWITVGGDVSEPEGVLAPLTLAGVATQTAVAMVEGEDDHATLMRWLGDETRNEVKDALKRKIEAGGIPSKKRS